MYYVGNIPVMETDIQHFGVLGMKWGVRRYQNDDGTLTEAGKKRYSGSTSERVSKTAGKLAAVSGAASVGLGVASNKLAKAYSATKKLAKTEAIKGSISSFGSTAVGLATMGLNTPLAFLTMTSGNTYAYQKFKNASDLGKKALNYAFGSVGTMYASVAAGTAAVGLGAAAVGAMIKNQHDKKKSADKKAE